jgi:hypothetical protein
MVPLATVSPDVAQLSDAELVERIESALQSLESIEASKASAWKYFRRFWGLSGRWPALSILGGFGRAGPLHPPLALEPAARTHQALREIRDLTDELERRVARDKAQRT